MSSNAVIRIKPYSYIHVLDNNSNVTRVVEGPRTFTRMDHETVVSGPDPMVMVPPRHYCIIQNPVQIDEEDSVIVDEHGQVKIRHGDEEIRFEQEPFALYPGEQLYGKVSPLQVVAQNTAIRLRAIRDFTDGEEERAAGDEWLFKGPATYIPRIEVQVLSIERATVVLDNQALRLRARKEFTDRNDVERKAGEEWIIRDTGAYLPDVNEEIRETLSAYILTEKKALQLEALRTFTDVFGELRKAGEQWLVTIHDAETHIPDVHEKVIGEVNVTTLNSRQYCVVLDPVDLENGKQLMGSRMVRKGEDNFFLLPGERLENGIQAVHVLGSEEGLLLCARERFEDGDEIRQPGDRWTLLGPCDYVPPVHVDIVEKRRSIPLDKNEGIYVRDITTGKVRSITGESYMLKETEELWEKNLDPDVEELLQKDGRYQGLSGERKRGGSSHRDKTRVVTYRTPHNSAVQVYDYKQNAARVVFGPDLVMLGPDEEFTVLSLSGDVPKRPGQIKALALLLGPDFMTDVVVVETSDHARLSLKLSYNWHFDVDEENPSSIFNVPDFVGDACKAVASMVRGCVAQHSFDYFHKNSAKIIRTSVFGTHEGTDKVKDSFSFSSNRLVLTNVDIQHVEPVDSRTRDALQKSVQLAIEITTKSQEAAARHEAERREQVARGELERQKIKDEADSERERTKLLDYQALSAAVEAEGQATAEASAKAKASEIESKAAVKQAELKSQAECIRAEAEIEQLKSKQNAEVEHRRKIIELDIKKAQELAEIETNKFNDAVDAIGADVISEIAKAGPEMQAKLLGGLGLQSFLITDGNSPINLFNTAKGMIGDME